MKFIRLNLNLSLVLGILFIFHSELKAEDKSRADAITHALVQAEESKEEKAEPEFTSDSYIRYLPTRSVKAQPGKISVIDTAQEFSYNFRAFGKLPLEFSLHTQYIGLNDKENMPVFLPAKLTGIGFGTQATVPFFDFKDTYLRFKVIPSFYADNWYARTSTFRIPTYAFLIYQPKEKLTLLVGVAAFPGYEIPVWPILGVIYKPNEKLSFNLIPDRPNIAYAITENLTLFGEGGITFKEFEVEKDGLKSAVLRYVQRHLGGGLKLSVNKYTDISLSTGYVFGRYLKYRDSLGKVNIKNSAYLELHLEMKI